MRNLFKLIMLACFLTPVDSLADIDFGLSGQPAEFNNGFTVNSGTADLSAATVTGLKSIGNIRASEGAGTDTSLTGTSNRKQILNITADRTYRLPSSGVAAGDTFEFVNDNAFFASFESSDTTAMGRTNTDNALDPSIRNGTVWLTALQASPTAPGHWSVKRQFNKRRWVRVRPTAGDPSIQTTGAPNGQTLQVDGLTIGKTYIVQVDLFMINGGGSFMWYVTNADPGISTALDGANGFVANGNTFGAGGITGTNEFTGNAYAQFVATDTSVFPMANTQGSGSFGSKAFTEGSQYFTQIVVYEVGEGELEATPLPGNTF